MILSEEKTQRRIERKMQMKIIDDMRMASLSPQARATMPVPITSYKSRSKYGIQGFETAKKLGHSAHIDVIDQLKPKGKTRNQLKAAYGTGEQFHSNSSMVEFGGEPNQSKEQRAIDDEVVMGNPPPGVSD